MVKKQSTLRIWIPSIAICSFTSVAFAQPAPVIQTEPAVTQSAPVKSTAWLGRKASAPQPRHAKEAAPTAADATSDAWTRPFEQVSALIAQSTNDYGITPSFSYEATFQGNVTGGASRTTAYAHIIEFGVKFDLDKIAQIPGASITVSGAHVAGRNLSAPSFINNAFTVSEVFVGHGTYLYQLFWEQKFVEDDFVIQIGRLNSSNFASLPAFGLQVSGGINGNPETLFLNSNFQSMPNTVWGAQASITPQQGDFYVSSGIFQATTLPGNQHGTDFSFRSSDRMLLMGEVGWTPTFGTDADKGYSGTYLAGFYFSNLPMARFDGTGDIKNTGGLYLMGQQTVWRNQSNSSEMIDVWGGFTYSPQGQVSQMEWMGFGGVVWQGVIPGRDRDQLLGTMLVGTFSSEYADSVQLTQPDRPTYEMVMEVSYVFNLNDYAFIQPDIQYIIRPNGVSSNRDALVLGVQFGLNF